MNNLRILIWIYLGLLVFEGALRKWVVPSLDAPLLIVRDPLVMWIYFQAWRNQLSFNNAFFAANLALAFSTALFSLMFGIGNVAVTLYGLRTDYLQIPLIFLIPQILNRDDVIFMGRYFLYFSIPLAALMVLQFRSSPDSWLNKGAMATQYDTVRPSGPFSFISGPISYLALTAAFLFFGFIHARTYKIWLMSAVTFAVLIAAACSGSRNCLASIGVVAVVAIMCVVTRGKGGMGILVAAVVIALAVPVLSSMSVVQQGEEQMEQRINDAAKTEGGAQGFFGRFTDSMLGPLATMDTVPFFGYGLGLGTNAAASLFHTKLDLYWPENEWARLIFECGPLFGFMLCIFRIALTVTLARRAFQAFRRDNILPILIFAACGLQILNGQWGVPTSLGFAIFGAGLTLAACVEPPEWEEENEEQQDDLAEDESDHSSSADSLSS